MDIPLSAAHMQRITYYIYLGKHNLHHRVDYNKCSYDMFQCVDTQTR